MMSRKFTKREEFMMILLTLIFCVAMYYLCIYEPSTKSINDAKIRLEDLESNMMIEQTKNTKLIEMREALAAIGYDPNAEEAVTVEIPDYDNAKNVYRELNEALKNVKGYSMTAKPLVFNNGMVTRQIQLSFTGENYAAVRAIILNLYSSKYKSDISSLVMTPTTRDSVTIADGEVSVTLTVDYYEAQSLLE